MNTSDASTSTEPRGAFSLAELTIPESALGRIRRSLYHSKEPGYHVFRDFLDEQAVNHLRRLWTTVEPTHGHQLFPGKQAIYFGCPNYFVVDANENRTFENFLWNAPLDELSYTTAICLQLLRNRVAGMAPFSELMPHGGKSVNYRVIVTRNAGTWVKPHRDYLDYERRFEKHRYDLSRLQGTLFLSEHGVDYAGGGLRFECNDGRMVTFGVDVDVAPGDLVLWRYNNLHSVEDVRSEGEQIGFVRMIFPPEDVALSPPVSAEAPNVARPGRIRQWFMRAVS